MQSGRGKLNEWILKFITRDSMHEPLMGWESSDDTLGEVTLKFSTKDQAIDFAKKNRIKDYRFKSCRPDHYEKS